MKASVVIPAYKADHLAQAVESVLAQTFTDYELIIVNDGSPFNIRKALEPYIKAGRIVYIEQENRGVAAARNRGLAEAKGEFLAFLDDDDYWPPDKLEWQVRHLDEHPETGMVLGNTTVVDANGVTKSEQSLAVGQVTARDFLSGNNYIYSPGQTLIRRSVLGGGEVFDGRIWGADDFDVWISIARKAGVDVVPRLAFYYRRHASNANSSPNALRLYESCEMVIRKHLGCVPGRDRARVACKGYEWLYGACGERAIMGCKARLRKGDASQLFRAGRMVMRLMLAAVYDSAFLRRVCRDVFIPIRFHRKPAS